MIDELVLLCLIGGNEKGLSTSDLGAGVNTLTSAKKNARKPDLSGNLSRLLERGFVEELPRSKGQRSSRWRLASAGDQAFHSIFSGIATNGRAWKQTAARSLIAMRKLGIPPQFAAACAKDKSLLTAYFLAKELGVKFDIGTTAQRLAEEIAARAVGAANSKPATLWRQIFERDTSQDSQPSPESNPAGADFAEQVKEAARHAKDGWFGPRKLFIHRAWSAWQDSTGQTLDLPVFKSRLLSGLRTGQLGLTRADFTVELDPSDLRESEIRDGDETFHFLTSEREDRQ